MTRPAPLCIHLTVSNPPRLLTHHSLTPRSLNFWGSPVSARTMKLLIIRKCWIRWWTSKRTTLSPATVALSRPETALVAAGGGRSLRSVAMAFRPPDAPAAPRGQPAQQLQVDVGGGAGVAGEHPEVLPAGEVGGDARALRRGWFVA